MKRNILQETFEKHVRLMHERLNLNENENQDPVLNAYKAVLYWGEMRSDRMINNTEFQEETFKVLRELLSNLSPKYTQKMDLKKVIEELGKMESVESTVSTWNHGKPKVKDILENYNDYMLDFGIVIRTDSEQLEYSIEELDKLKNWGDKEGARGKASDILTALLKQIKPESEKPEQYENDPKYKMEEYMEDVLNELKPIIDKEKYEKLEKAYKNVPTWDDMRN